MNIIADLHTHTSAAGHGFSTLLENCLAAKKIGHTHIALTEHAPKMPGGPTYIYFGAMRTLPRVIEGVYVLRGAELNILDWEGKVDLKQRQLGRLDFVIASYHEVCIEPGNEDEHTAGYLNILKNPLIDCLGHIGNGMFPCDYDRVVRECRDLGKLIEINNHSFECREGSHKNCREVALLCKKYGVSVAVTSDSHFCYSVGVFPNALSLLHDVDFPEELVINSSHERLREWFLYKKELDIGRGTF